VVPEMKTMDCIMRFRLGVWESIVTLGINKTYELFYTSKRIAKVPSPSVVLQ
jgi:hypothetical protein